MPCNCGAGRVRDLRMSVSVRVFCAACKVDHSEDEYKRCPRRLKAVAQQAAQASVMSIVPVIQSTRVVGTPQLVRTRPTQFKGPIFRKSGLTLSDIPRRR